MHLSYQLITLDSVSKSYGPKKVLSKLSFSLSQGQKMGLIGENGVGKTTLVKVLVGCLSPDSGKVRIKEGCSIGYLPQGIDLKDQSHLTVDQFLDNAQKELKFLSEKLNQLEDQMAEASSDAAIKELTEMWDKLHSVFLAKEGYSFAEKKDQLISALDLEYLDKASPLKNLSGGQLRKLYLGSILLEVPDILILDEPTNHLDKPAIKWLEGYLSKYKGAVLLVSHDRYFLNRVANGILELEQTTNQLQYYDGNYDSYVVQKKKEQKKLLEIYERQKEKIGNLKRFLKQQTFSPKKVGVIKDHNKMAYDKRGERYNHAKGTKLKKAKQKLKVLEEEQIEHPIPKGYTGIVFTKAFIKSPYAIRLENIKMAYGGHVIIDCLTETLCPGDRVILKKENGSGKTTLLNMLAKKEQPTSGSVYHSPQIKMGYLPQKTALSDQDLTVLEYLEKRCSFNESKICSKIYQMGVLEAALISQRVKSLSLGQKRKLILLQLMLQDVNVLLLDEPTNHLSPLMIDTLEEALLSFEGAIVAATHDRRFIERIGNCFWEWNK